MENKRCFKNFTEEERKQYFNVAATQYYYKYHELNLKRSARHYIVRKLQQARAEGKDEAEIMNKLRIINKEINQMQQEAKNKIQ